MLDLNTESTPLYQIKLYDGRILNLKRPTQDLQRLLVTIYNKDQYSTEFMINTFFAAFTTILNRNDEGIKFEDDEIAEEYGLEIAGYVIGDYFKYWNDDVNRRVSFQ